MQLPRVRTITNNVRELCFYYDHLGNFQMRLSKLGPGLFWKMPFLFVFLEVLYYKFSAVSTLEPQRTCEVQRRLKRTSYKAWVGRSMPLSVLPNGLVPMNYFILKSIRRPWAPAAFSFHEQFSHWEGLPWRKIF